MGNNLFGLEAHAYPLGNRFLHATVVPVGKQFMSTISVEEESAVVYRREHHFSTLEQARIDLHAQLRVMNEVPLEDLMRVEAHVEDFTWGDHRRISASLTNWREMEWVPLDVIWKYREYDRSDRARIEEIKQSLQTEGFREPLILIYSKKDRTLKVGEGNHRLVAARELGMTAVPCRVIRYEGSLSAQDEALTPFKNVPGMEPDRFGYVPGDMKPSQIGLPTVPAPKQASEQEGEFDTHEPTSIGDVLPKSHYLSRRTATALEHYSWRPNLKQVDPKFHGSGIAGAESRRKRNDPANWVDRAYFYDAGSSPEPDLQGAVKYVAQLPAGAVIYDMGADPDRLKQQSLNPAGGVDDTLMEKNVKDAGYFGFRNSKGTMPYAVGVFYPVPVTPSPESVEENKHRGEMLLTTVFVKRAGSTENFLQSVGATPDVIQFVTAQPEDVAKKLVNEVRKNNQLTVTQLQQMAQQMASKQKYEPTPREIDLAAMFQHTPGLGQWVLLQAKKYRGRKVVKPETKDYGLNPNLNIAQPEGTTRPTYEFEYKWPADIVGSPRAPRWSLSFMEPVFRHIQDWIYATQAQINSYDLPSAIAESNKWHESLAGKESGEDYQERNVVYTFKNGWTMQLVKSENDLEAEGNKMGHCVGGYCEHVTMGDSIIYSLRDTKNEPHATIEVKGDVKNDPEEGEAYPYYQFYETDPTRHGPISGQWEIVQIQGKENREPIPEYKKMIKEWFQSLGKGNVSMGSTSAYNIYDRLYNAEPEEMAELIEAADHGEEDDYGIPHPSEHFDMSNMSHLYEHIEARLMKRTNRDQRYNSRVMRPIAYALADLTWNADMREAMTDPETWSIVLANKPLDLELVMKFFTNARSAMSGIHKRMDEHQEEFDKYDFDPGILKEEFATEDEYLEAYDEARNEVFGEWISGGMDNAINDRWNMLAKENGGKYPWDVLKENVARLQSEKRRKQPNA